MHNKISFVMLTLSISVALCSSINNINAMDKDKQDEEQNKINFINSINFINNMDENTTEPENNISTFNNNTNNNTEENKINISLDNINQINNNSTQINDYTDKNKEDKSKINLDNIVSSENNVADKLNNAISDINKNLLDIINNHPVYLLPEGFSDSYANEFPVDNILRIRRYNNDNHNLMNNNNILNNNLMNIVRRRTTTKQFVDNIKSFAVQRTEDYIPTQKQMDFIIGISEAISTLSDIPSKIHNIALSCRWYKSYQPYIRNKENITTIIPGCCHIKKLEHEKFGLLLTKTPYSIFYNYPIVHMKNCGISYAGLLSALNYNVVTQVMFNNDNNSSQLAYANIIKCIDECYKYEILNHNQYKNILIYMLYISIKYYINTLLDSIKEIRSREDNYYVIDALLKSEHSFTETVKNMINNNKNTNQLPLNEKCCNDILCIISTLTQKLMLHILRMELPNYRLIKNLDTTLCNKLTIDIIIPAIFYSTVFSPCIISVQTESVQIQKLFNLLNNEISKMQIAEKFDIKKNAHTVVENFFSDLYKKIASKEIPSLKTRIGQMQYYTYLKTNRKIVIDKKEDNNNNYKQYKSNTTINGKNINSEYILKNIMEFLPVKDRYNIIRMLRSN